MIKFACPGCSATFTVGDEKAGKSGKCPKCQTQFVIPAAGGAAPAPTKKAPAPAPAPEADDAPVEIRPCPKCDTRLSVLPTDVGLDIECPNCQTVFKALKAGASAAVKPQSKPSRPADDEDEEDDRPVKKGRSSRRDEEEDEDDRPKKKSRRGDDEEDDRPKKKASKREDDEDDDRPKKKSSKRGVDDEDEEERPSKSKRALADADDEDADRPSKRGSKRGDDDEDDDDDRPRKKKGKGKKKSGDIGESKRMTAALLAIFLGGWGVHKFYLGYSTAGVIQIVLSLCLLGAGVYIGWIEGIIYLTKTDEDFIDAYQRNEKQWF